MSAANNTQPDLDMLPEYDFSNGVRGKYAQRLAQIKAMNKEKTIMLAPDVAPFFPDSEAVNEALRMLIKIAHQGIVPATE